MKIALPIERDDRALDLVGEAAEVIEPVLRDARLRPHLGEQLAVLPGLDRGDAIGVLGDLLAPFHQQPPAPVGDSAPHGPPERGRRRRHGAVHFAGTGEREGPPHGAGRRIEGGERAAVGGGDVRAGDVVLIGVHESLRVERRAAEIAEI